MPTPSISPIPDFDVFHHVFRYSVTDHKLFVAEDLYICRCHKAIVCDHIITGQASFCVQSLYLVCS